MPSGHLTDGGFLGKRWGSTAANVVDGAFVPVRPIRGARSHTRRRGTQSARGLSGLDEKAGGVAYERSVPLDVLVHGPESVSISLDREPRHVPDHETQEVHHRPDVVEDGPEAFLTEIHDAQPRRFGARHGELRVSPGASWLWTEHELRELPDTVRSDLRGQ